MGTQRANLQKKIALALEKNRAGIIGALRAHQAHKEIPIEELFEAIDANGEGKITVEKLAKFLDETCESKGDDVKVKEFLLQVSVDTPSAEENPFITAQDLQMLLCL